MSNYRFGKHPVKKDYRTLRLSNYLTSTIAPPPSAYDNLQKVFANTGINNPSQLFPIDGNDTLGDCTIAGVAHAITLYQALAGNTNIITANDVIKFYYSQTRGLDTGLVELDVLNYWQSNQIFDDQLLAFTSIDPKNHAHVQLAISLFGGVYLGFQVQQNCLNDFNNGNIWTPGILLNEGHAVFATSYDQNTISVLTWGKVQKGTWDWWDCCVDEAYALVPPEVKDPGIPGIDCDQLLSDLKNVAN